MKVNKKVEEIIITQTTRIEYLEDQNKMLAEELSKTRGLLQDTQKLNTALNHEVARREHNYKQLFSMLEGVIIIAQK